MIRLTFIPLIFFILLTISVVGQDSLRKSDNGVGLLRSQFGDRMQFSSNPKKQNYIYEIPNNFTGTITIFVSESCGVKIEKRKELKILTIPADGVLILKEAKLEVPYTIKNAYGNNSGEFRYNPNKYLTKDSLNKWIELPELVEEKFDSLSQTEFTKNQKGVFHKGFGSGEQNSKNGLKLTYSYYKLFVGSYEQLKSDKYFIEGIRKGEESSDKLKKCRGL